MGKHWRWIVGLIFLLHLTAVLAGEVQIQGVEFERQGAAWLVSVTVKHEDTGWEHYADAWRVVGGQGELYGTRTLSHPHISDMPFTRALTGIAIPEGTTTVWVEAHDNKHGWSSDRIRVDLNQSKGDRFEVRQFPQDGVGLP